MIIEYGELVFSILVENVDGTMWSTQYPEAVKFGAFTYCPVAIDGHLPIPVFCLALLVLQFFSVV